jgi:hypothetical protein
MSFDCQLFDNSGITAAQPFFGDKVFPLLLSSGLNLYRYNSASDYLFHISSALSGRDLVQEWNYLIGAFASRG